MTGTNHALTGGVIGLAFGGPVAIPLAFASHFVCDWLPHYGAEGDDHIQNKKYFYRIVAVDAILLTAGLTVVIALGLPWYVIVSALAAMSPDFAWIYQFIFDEKMGKLEPKPKSRFNQFHADIQKRETPSGLWFELIWFVGMLIIAINLL